MTSIHTDMKSAEQSVLRTMTEEGYARWRAARGVRVVESRGRWWEYTHRGFYCSIHWLARMTPDQARRPTAACWGFRTTIQGDGNSAANAAMPVHLLSDVANYDMQTLPSKRRNQLRKCQKEVELVELTGPGLLEREGYAVFRSARERLGVAHIPGEHEYQASLQRNDLTRDDNWLVMAGLVNSHLAGYLEGYAVDGAAYVQSVFLATEYLSSNVGTGLAFEFVQACRRSGEIHEVVYGQHFRENQTLDVFKEGMGFPVTPIPTRVWIMPVLKSLIRWKSPGAYYRLIGQ